MTQTHSSAPSESARHVTSAASEEFVAATRQLDCGTPVVCVTGEVDLTTAPALTQALLAVAEDRAGEVIVDLTGCSFLDGRGLRALVAASARFERSNRSLALVLSHPNVLKIFRITGFDGDFEIYPSLSAAVGGNGHHV